MKDQNLIEAALISRGVSIETTNGQDQTTLATRLLHKCLEDGRIEPETVALLRLALRQFPDQTPRGRPVNVVARELMARRDAIRKLMSVTFHQALAGEIEVARYREIFERIGPDLKRLWGDYTGELQSIRHASQSLGVDRKNIRDWRKDPKYQEMVKKFYDEYVGQGDND